MIFVSRTYTTLSDNHGGMCSSVSSRRTLLHFCKTEVYRMQLFVKNLLIKNFFTQSFCKTFCFTKPPCLSQQRSHSRCAPAFLRLACTSRNVRTYRSFTLLAFAQFRSSTSSRSIFATASRHLAHNAKKLRFSGHFLLASHLSRRAARVSKT